MNLDTMGMMGLLRGKFTFRVGGTCEIVGESLEW